MNFTVRKAVSEDFEGIYLLNRDCMGHDYPPDKTHIRLEKLLANTQHDIFVAGSPGLLLGYVHMHDYQGTYFDHAKNILALAVTGSARRNGIASALMAACEEKAKLDGCSIIRLVSGESRTGAHKFYESQGYVSNKNQKNFSKDLVQNKE